ncbi:N-acetylglucosaminyldiphosphodolichol N-acetylglucosaminyltransferase catalytic subunit alg13 [Phlyctochytrium planicorne]|nr:N-acetylglucosaminyldiphosphodolichol N-acetylglucosaminyltransferase catalytic subunit alg13 [Phlyctochytrium planicorne]
MKLFITVGSTKFDLLVQVVGTTDFIKAIKDLGFTHLTLQHGASKNPFETTTITKYPNLTIETFDYKPSIDEFFKEADLIISHAGSGSILESMFLRKRLIVVPNETLMDNHQVELAEAMEENGKLVHCYPNGLVEELKSRRWEKLNPVPPGDPTPIIRVLEEEAGGASIIIILAVGAIAPPAPNALVEKLNTDINSFQPCVRTCLDTISKPIPKGGYKDEKAALNGICSSTTAIQNIGACVATLPSCASPNAASLNQLVADCVSLGAEAPTASTPSTPVTDPNDKPAASSSPAPDESSGTSGNSGGGSNSGVAAGVSVTIILLLAITGAVLGYLYIRKKRQANPDFDIKSLVPRFGSVKKPTQLQMPPATPLQNLAKEKEQMAAAGATVLSQNLAGARMPSDATMTADVDAVTAVEPTPPPTTYPNEKSGNLFTGVSSPDSHVPEKSGLFGSTSSTSAAVAAAAASEKSSSMFQAASSSGPSAFASRDEKRPIEEAFLTSTGSDLSKGGAPQALMDKIGQPQGFSIEQPRVKEAGGNDMPKSLPVVPAAAILSNAPIAGTIATWGPTEVSQWLHSIGMKDEIVENLKGRGLNGQKLLMVSDDSLLEMGVDQPGIRSSILSNLKVAMGQNVDAEVADVPPPYMGN